MNTKFLAATFGEHWFIYFMFKISFQEHFWAMMQISFFFKTKVFYIASTILSERLRWSSQTPAFVCSTTWTTWADTAKTASCRSGCRTPSSLWWAFNLKLSVISKLNPSAEVVPAVFLQWLGFGSTSEMVVQHRNSFSRQLDFIFSAGLGLKESCLFNNVVEPSCKSQLQAN